MADTVFSYNKDIEQLLPNLPSVKNPYYRIADVYEPCDGFSTDFDTAVVNITRGHGTGVTVNTLLQENIEVKSRRVTIDTWKR